MNAVGFHLVWFKVVLIGLDLHTHSEKLTRRVIPGSLCLQQVGYRPMICAIEVIGVL